MNSNTPLKSRPLPGHQGSTPFRSASASRFRSSLVPMNRPSPARSAHPTNKLPANTTFGRDIFRTSTPQTTRTTKFTPSLPVDATRTTPGGRKFAQKTSSHGGMSSIPSTEPFKMRIPSPDPDLSGEALSKQVPDDPNRRGTIYADQFLAHKCPPDFDDLQRRQFFCILDLRRLKYAADEIFAKKDWKLNIMNFAKEYEKSRGLIMLRYGLYEFKNVKPSEEVLRRWRATHGLPEPEPERETTAPETPVQHNRRPAAPNTATTKRKAEDDLAPKDNALMASTANQNKRRNIIQESADAALTGPAPFKKSKRKMDETDEPDENQPSKLQKPTPSAAKSKFESILNKASSGNTSPMKRTPLAPFGTQKSSDSQNSNLPSKLNPFAASTNGLKHAGNETATDGTSTGSVLSTHKIGSVPTTTTGIFSYLSESSPNSSGNEDGNADDGETESESEEETGSQEVAPSDEPSAPVSTGVNTPTPTPVPTQSGSTLFPASKPTNAAGLFGGLTKPSDLASKGGLFGRVQMGSNGQLLRATPDSEEKGSLSPTKPAIEKEQIKTPAKRPGDYTFNPATTPISFGQSMPGISETPATISNPDIAKESSKPEAASTAGPSVLFGASAPATPVFQPTAQSLFGGLNKPSDSPQAKSNGVASSIFSGQKSAPASSSSFAPTASKALFGGASTSEPGTSAVKEQPNGTADTTPRGSASATSQANASETPSAPTEHTSIFGTSTANTNATPQPQVLFGNSLKIGEFKVNGNTSSQPLFGTSGNPPASSLFGASPSTPSFGADNAKANSSGAVKSLFETPKKQLSASFTFGESKPAATGEANKGSNVFGQGTNIPTTPMANPIFGSGAGTSSLFGGNSTTSTGLFDSKNGEATPAKKNDDSTATKSSIFNNTPSTAAPIFTFGGQTTPSTNNQPPFTPLFSGAGINATQTQGTESKKPTIQFGNAASTASTTPFTFGQTSSDSGFTFTAGGDGQSINNPFASSTPAPATPMFGGTSSTPAPSSSFNFSFGQQAPSTPNPPPASQGTGMFGVSSGPGNGAPSFSFTSATPQGTPNPFSSKPTTAFSVGSGSFLQAGGDISTGASSPFPAPSSIGTTPVSGTPEPQTQNEDHEEAPQEQISLTDGGPGEEDEIILHEIRAKAIKYVPVVKGSDEEEERKSPWSTQGVGPLRVLKNKSTGTVRVLLRAEPRGHVAMNKALLSDVGYGAKDKTVNFVAANDSGSGLETWVLQVKKPEYAQQLALALEANKSANKK
ncbi:hypothetical protein AAE478_006495 [Parahypoxylon ruwenzoriense]